MAAQRVAGPAAASRRVPAGNHRTKPRRRGEKLLAAIFEATLQELADVGFAGLTMAGVAERAGTGKASLYRRWPGRTELVLDALCHAVPPEGERGDTGSLRGDLLLRLGELAGVLAGPVGAAARGLVADAVRDPELAWAVRERIAEPALDGMRQLFERAVARGEIADRALSPLVVSVAPTLLRHHFLFHGAPIPEPVLVAIVDEVVLPLVGVAPVENRGRRTR